MSYVKRSRDSRMQILSRADKMNENSVPYQTDRRRGKAKTYQQDINTVCTVPDISESAIQSGNSRFLPFLPRGMLGYFKPCRFECIIMQNISDLILGALLVPQYI